MVVGSYKDLRIWQESIAFSKEIYALADQLPPKELYGLRSQMTRAVVSVACNIAEGSRRRSTKELLQFLAMAHASLAEIETQLTIAVNIGYLENKQCAPAEVMAEKLSRGIKKLIKTLETRA